MLYHAPPPPSPASPSPIFSLHFYLFGFFAQCYRSLFDFIWPNICVACFNICEKDHTIFCRSCSMSCSLLSSSSRCYRCFSLVDIEIDDTSSTYDDDKLSSWRFHCIQCFSSSLHINKSAACFLSCLATQKMHQEWRREIYRYGRKSQSYKTVASFLFLQTVELDFPFIDTVIFLPNAAFAKKKRIVKEKHIVEKKDCDAFSILSGPAATYFKEMYTLFHNTHSNIQVWANMHINYIKPSQSKKILLIFEKTPSMALLRYFHDMCLLFGFTEFYILSVLTFH